MRGNLTSCDFNAQIFTFRYPRGTRSPARAARLTKRRVFSWTIGALARRSSRVEGDHQSLRAVVKIASAQDISFRREPTRSPRTLWRKFSIKVGPPTEENTSCCRSKDMREGAFQKERAFHKIADFPEHVHAAIASGCIKAQDGSTDDAAREL